MDTTTFTYTDPREFDGSPFEAARGAAEQLSALIKLAKSAAADTFVLARVADLQRQQDNGQENPNASWFENGPLGLKLKQVERELQALGRTSATLANAVSYDPANPPKED